MSQSPYTTVRYLGWVLLGLYLVLGAVGLTLQLLSSSTPYGTGPPTTEWANYLSFGVWAFVGALLIFRRPRNPISYCYALVPLGAVLVDFSYGILYYGAVVLSDPLPGSQFAGFWLASSAFLASVYILSVLSLLFPTGKTSSPVWKAVIWTAGAALAVYAVAGVLSPDHLLNPSSSFWLDPPPFDPDPFGLSEAALSVVGMVRWAAYGVVLLSLVLAIGQMAVRLRRSEGIERLQLKWIVFAFGFVIVGLALLITSITVSSEWGGVIQLAGGLVLGGGIAGIAVASGIAILRYRLFDIDIIIRRTTQYAIVTALLVLVYFGSIILLQRLFTAFTGQTSTLAVVLSTLLIAAIFLPVRRRVQDAIDRRFFRQKYDAQKTLEAFASTVRDETDLDALTAELVRVIEETMQPEHVSVWLAPEVASRGPEPLDDRRGEA